MADGGFRKWVSQAQSHPVVGIIALVSTGVFAFGIVVAVVRRVSHLGWGYGLLIAVPAGLFAICLALLYYHSVRSGVDPLRRLSDVEPTGTREVFEVKKPEGPPLSMVVDDLSAVIQWTRPDDSEDSTTFAYCRIHVTNLAGTTRLLKADLVRGHIHGTVFPDDDARMDGVYLGVDAHTAIGCRFEGLPGRVIGEEVYVDEVELTDDLGRKHRVEVTFGVVASWD